MSIDDFKRNGGSLSGREERRDQFAGEPKSVGGTLGGPGAHGTTSLTERGSRSGNPGYRSRRHHKRSTSNSSYSSSSDDDELRRSKGSKLGGYANRSHRSKNPLSSSNRTGGYTEGSSVGGTTHHGATGTAGNTAVPKSTGLGSNHGPSAALDNRGAAAGTNHSTTHDTKPSLLDRLNPMKDTDHDGKKGFMD